MKDYFKGIIGGLIGGLVATIPWILMYLYGGMMLSLLAIIIGSAVVKGYQLFKGKVDNKFPIIIIAISLISITIATFVIIPLCLLIKVDIPISIENFTYMYQSADFVGTIIRDYVISVIFTLLGISGIVQSVKKQVAENKEVITLSNKDKSSKKEDSHGEKEEIDKNNT